MPSAPAKPVVRRESDLWEPVRDYLAAQGFAVQAEVSGCDILARRDEDLVVVELKRSPCLELIHQALDRQEITDSVYVALPAESGRAGSRRRKFRRLLRRLEIGLLLVHFTPTAARVELAFHPLPAQRRKLAKRKRAVLSEWDNRERGPERAGVNRCPMLTAYRESSLRIAECLDREGPSTPRALRDKGAGPKTQSILYNNHYGWFQRLDRGLYGITAQGRQALTEWPSLSTIGQEDSGEDPPHTPDLDYRDNGRCSGSDPVSHVVGRSRTG